MSPLDWNAAARTQCEGMREVPLGQDCKGNHSERSVLREMFLTEAHRHMEDLDVDAVEEHLDETHDALVTDCVSQFWTENFRQSATL